MVDSFGPTLSTEKSLWNVNICNMVKTFVRILLSSPRHRGVRRDNNLEDE
jgi:hypothetical protein